jgi:hypothetical protein
VSDTRDSEYVHPQHPPDEEYRNDASHDVNNPVASCFRFSEVEHAAMVAGLERCGLRWKPEGFCCWGCCAGGKSRFVRCVRHSAHFGRNDRFVLGRRRLRGLLGDGSLVAYSQPVAGAADPDSGVAIGAAEVFAQLVALDVGACGDDGGVAVDAHHHVTHVDGVVAQLAAFAGGNSVLLGGDLAERRDGDVVLGEGALGKVGVAADAGFAGLVFEVNDFANRGLLGRIEGGVRMHRDVLGREGRQRKQRGQQ